MMLNAQNETSACRISHWFKSLFQESFDNGRRYELLENVENEEGINWIVPALKVGYLFMID